MNNSLFSSIRNNANRKVFNEISKVEYYLSMKSSKENQPKDLEEAIEDILYFFVKN